MYLFSKFIIINITIIIIIIIKFNVTNSKFVFSLQFSWIHVKLGAENNEIMFVGM